jgi:hypothetical protein
MMPIRRRADNHRRIRDPLFQRTRVDKQKQVLYGIVTQLRGVIEMESHVEGENHGTEFRLFLPLADSAL